MPDNSSLLFSATLPADRDALRAVAKREWEPGVNGHLEPLDTYLGWAHTLHFWVGEMSKLAPLDADALTDMLRDLRALPEGAEQEEALMRSMRGLAEQLGTAAAAFVSMADRLETAAARLKLEGEE